MAKSYIHIDGGAEVDPFWGMPMHSQPSGISKDQLVEQLKKSFYKNATKLDFVSTEKGHFTVGKIGTNDTNTEYRIWKSYEHIHNTDIVEELFKTDNETAALSEFNEITGGSFKLECKINGKGMQSAMFEQAEIGKSEVERMNETKDHVQDILDYRASSNFARNSQKIDFVPGNDGKVVVLGMIGKSEMDRGSKYRIWKTYDHWKNESVEYLSEEMDRRSALSEFAKITKSI